MNSNKTATGVLGRVKLEIVLINAHTRLGKKYRGSPLWTFVADMCGTGSTTSTEIAKALGWDPHQDGAKSLRWMGREPN